MWSCLIFTILFSYVTIDHYHKGVFMNIEKLETDVLSAYNLHAFKNDPSHDELHTKRVIGLAKNIAHQVNADLKIVIPGAAFHDVIVYPKHLKKSANESQESASIARSSLEKLPYYPKKKIPQVEECILQCSFSKGITPKLLEAQVVQDADRLEATGAFAIMRTFSSCGQWNTPFYLEEDPFCESRDPKNFASGIDLFYQRLLVVESLMNTDYAKNLAQQRTKFLNDFLLQVKLELFQAI